jgi:glycosyltransferase involved in cell wall biosynthesis
VATRPLRVLFVAKRPVQYGAPMFRRYASDPRLEVTVAYCSMQGAVSGMDPEFGIDVAWDIPLLDGYRWVNPRNIAPWPSIGRFFGLINPGLWSLIRRGHFDIVVCHGYRTASFVIAALAALSAGSRLVLTVDAYGEAPRTGGRTKAFLRKKFLPWILRAPHGIFVPSSVARRFLSSIGVPIDRIFLTPMVTDADFFAEQSSEVDRPAVRASWGFEQDAFVVAFVGKLVWWKRAGDVLEAVAALSISAVLAGDGASRGELERRASDLGVTSRVRFLGFVNQGDLPSVYAASDVLVLPSSYEPFGVVVSEAFACGRSAVVSDACGAVGDLVVDGVTGLVFRTGDVESLVSGLRRLIDDPQVLVSLEGHARERIAQWGWRANQEAVVQACQELVGRP